MKKTSMKTERENGEMQAEGRVSSCAAVASPRRGRKRALARSRSLVHYPPFLRHGSG